MMQSKKRWIFVIFDKIITEQDIYGTLKMLKEFRCSDSKIILLAIKDIDNSAKLLAKQKHLWVWGHGDMMRLFEFYKGYAISIA
jgi:hypothetical protein